MKHIAAYALLVLGGKENPSKSSPVAHLLQLTQKSQSSLRTPELKEKKKA
jgi:hypothetical protein